MDNAMLASIAVGIVFVLAAPNVKVAALIVLASGTLMYARTKTYSVKSIGSRFTETDKILQKIDEDKFISSSGSAISAVRRKDVSTIHVQ
jgi:hypothetical protein